jgi:hypothetical protein
MRLLATKRFLLRCAKYASATTLELDSAGNNKLTADVTLGTLSPSNLSIFTALDGRYLAADALDVDNISVFGRLLTDVELSTDVTTLFGSFVGSVNTAVTSDGHANNDVVVRQWYNYGLYLNRVGNPVISGIVQLNGHNRFSERDGNYLNYVQPW